MKSQPCTDLNGRVTQAKEEWVQTQRRNSLYVFNSRENWKAEWEGRITQSGVGRVERLHISQGPCRSLWFHHRDTSFPGGSTIRFIFCFILFLFATWFHPGHPSLVPCKWIPAVIPRCPFPLSQKSAEVSSEEPLSHFRVLLFQLPVLHSVWWTNEKCFYPYSTSLWHLGSWLCCLRKTF